MGDDTEQELRQRIEDLENRLASLNTRKRRFFLDTDSGGNWYVIPVDEEEKWCEIKTMIEDGSAGIYEWGIWEDKFMQYRLRNDVYFYSFSSFRCGHHV